jgi:5'(3')-deoxyribonucleotidase
MLISLDMDDVIVDWKQQVLDYWNEDRPDQRRTINQMTNWDIVDDLGEHARFYIRAYMRYPNFYQDIKPIHGAIEGVRMLLKTHEVAIVTATPKSAGMAYEGKLQWLRRYIPEFPLDNLVSMKRKEWAPGAVLIDDGMHNLEAFQKTGRTAMCFDRPWNREWTGLRLCGWDSVTRYFCDEPVTATSYWSPCYRCEQMGEKQYMQKLNVAGSLKRWHCDDCAGYVHASWRGGRHGR